jgi:hypothetical protein
MNLSGKGFGVQEFNSSINSGQFFKIGPVMVLVVGGLHG